MENLRKQFECIVCLNYMRPPIMLCDVGHSLCNKCNKMISNCPICRATLSGKRNYKLEEIYELIDFPCKYKGKGCKHLCKGKELNRHENICKYAPKPCFFYNCNWIGNIYFEYKEHVFTQHLNKILKSAIKMRLSVKLSEQSKWDRPKQYIFYGDQTIFNVFINYENKFLIFGVNIVNNILKNLFYFEVIIKNLAGEDEIKLIKKCSERKDVHISNTDCLRYPYEQVEMMLDKQGKLALCFGIIMKSTNNTDEFKLHEQELFLDV